MKKYLSKTMSVICQNIMVLMLLLFIQSSSFAQKLASSFMFEGSSREYIVYLPRNFQPNMPVVLNLHGYTMAPSSQAYNTLMHEIGDTAGFIVVYPACSSPGWNSGLRDHPFGRQDTTSNDVGFLNTLIDTLHAQYEINLNHIYCCGYSMGGEMTYRMAIESGERFAAFASVAGKINDVSANSGIPVRPFKIIHFHGTNDNTETYYGVNDGNLWPVEETIEFWIDNNNCIFGADTVYLPDIAADGHTVQKISYKNCSDDSQVVFFKIIGGGHGWPGARGKASDINASVEICNFFFEDYENPYANIAFGTEVEVFPKYFQALGDSIKITGKIINRFSHKISVFAKIQAEKFSFRDSIQMFDDGLHGDGNPDDNIYGCAEWYAGLTEDMYMVDVTVYDSIEGTTHNSVIPGRFTTTGPVSLKDYSFSNPDDTAFYPGKQVDFNLRLKNSGSTGTASKIEAILWKLDQNISISSPKNSFEDIPPQESSISQSSYSIFISSNSPVNSEASIVVTISSDGHTYWTDTLSILIQEAPTSVKIYSPQETLTRIYPNPVVDFIIIEADWNGEYSVEISSLSGQFILSEKAEGTTHQIDLSSFQKGAYFITIRSKDFVTTRKIIKL